MGSSGSTNAISAETVRLSWRPEGPKILRFRPLLQRTAAISPDAEASKVSEERIVSGNLDINSRSISRRVARGLPRKSGPARTGGSNA